MLYDNHGRIINYLRLAITDRCNLRCFYCMPEEGIDYLPRTDLLTFEEMEKLISLFATEGISKVRITGGEPFLRRGIMDFIERLTSIPGIEKVNITTNGILTSKHIPKLKSLGINSMNLSLDTLDRKRFQQITRRDSFEDVMETLHLMQEHDIQVKINMVVMEQHNIDDIIPMLELTRDKDINVRFIEEMPFNGTGKAGKGLTWDFYKMLEFIKENYSGVHKLEDPAHSTAFNYKIEGFKGSFGIIAAYTRLFCGSCNRIRLTPQGTIKTCLYDDGVFSIRDLMRSGVSDEDIVGELKKALGQRPKDGIEAEQNRKLNPRVSESMATIGG